MPDTIHHCEACPPKSLLETTDWSHVPIWKNDFPNTEGLFTQIQGITQTAHFQSVYIHIPGNPVQLQLLGEAQLGLNQCFHVIKLEYY